jgi:hypothetical protein
MTRVQAIEEEIKSLSRNEFAELRDWLLAGDRPSEPEITRESLVEQITDDNRHDEIETGSRAGNEVW